MNSSLRSLCLVILLILGAAYSQLAYAGDDCTSPAGFRIEQVNSTSARLVWQGVVGATGFIVNIENDNGNPTFFNLERTVNTLDFTVTGLLPSANYKAKVRTVCGGGDKSDWSVDISFRTVAGDGNNGGGTGPCNVPANLRIEMISDTSARVTWNKVPGVQSYEVEVEDDENTPAFNRNVTTSDTTLVVNGLVAGGRYQSKVKSKCSGGNSEYSPWVFFTATPGGGSDGTGNGGGTSPNCAVPSGLRVESVTDSTATLSWVAVAGVSAYEVEVEDDENTPPYRRNLIVNGTSVTVTGMVRGGSYEFKVKSKCSDGNSLYSPSLAFTPGRSVGDGAPTGDGSCATPGDLRALMTSDSTATLSWKAVAGVNAYELEVEDEENTAPYFFKVISGDTMLQVRGLIPGGNYQFKVKSKCGGGNNSAYSNWVFFSTNGITGGGGQPPVGNCTTPAGLTVKILTGSRIQLTWNAIPGARLYEFELEHSERTAPFHWKAIVGRNSATVIGLKAGGNYKVKVRTRCGGGKSSAYSGWLFFNMPAVIPVIGTPGATPASLDDFIPRLFPNPVQEQLSISLPEPLIAEGAILQIMDTNGRILWNQQVEAGAAGNLRVPVQNWQNGLYLLQVRAAGRMDNYRFIVTHQ